MAWVRSRDARTRVGGAQRGRWGACRTPGLPALVVGLALSACASAQTLDGLPSTPPAPAGFVLGRDTFAFRNLVRSHDPDRDVAFANYCIIMVRAATQFFRFARFAPSAPPGSPDEYTRLAREVMAIGPWEPVRPADQRVVIPGYPDLFTWSRAQEAAIKAAFGSSLLSMLHWRTWRVTLSFSPGHQSAIAAELTEEIRGGRPVPVMITNYPQPDLLNHAVLVYDYRARVRLVEFLAYDPNDPGAPLSLHFQRDTGSFWVGPLPYGPPGRIRAFRLYASPLL